MKVRMEIGFPARGRTICSGELIRILFEFLPECVESTLFWRRISKDAVRKAVDLADDQASVRAQLPELGLCALWPMVRYSPENPESLSGRCVPACPLSHRRQWK